MSLAAGSQHALSCSFLCLFQLFSFIMQTCNIPVQLCVQHNSGLDRTHGAATAAGRFMTSLSADFFQPHQPDVDRYHRHLMLDKGWTQAKIDELK